MSFQDIEAGYGSLARSAGALTETGKDADSETCKLLMTSLSLQVLKINANVQGILRCVDQLGTAIDNANLRKQLHDLTDATQAMAKRSSGDMKKLSGLQSKLARHNRNTVALQKISRDLQMALASFQRAQQQNVERQRTFVIKSAKLASETEHYSTSLPSSRSRERQYTQIQQSPFLPNYEVAYQETIAQERQAEIREIESGIHEISTIFQQLGTLANQQGAMLDDFSMNISSVVADTGAAVEELSTGAEYQRKAGRRSACLMLVLVVIGTAVLLAILG
ncbi:hypothetical protein EST38_g13396 [Candolleomyces aberdarensis]|uniref:t-SNARE coiled-coil homology domain-containing protein n=1 Tax=Candolleomyces aberdarensis TaxID=2316362 RepID=A0A4Q2D024_9AGAR|nr:hypothetical protein EST38_g13396 [Candolleomyces aberdarensis]